MLKSFYSWFHPDIRVWICHTSYRKCIFSLIMKNMEILEAISYYVSNCKAMCFQYCDPAVQVRKEKWNSLGINAEHLWVGNNYKCHVCTHCCRGWATKQLLKTLNEIEHSRTGIFGSLPDKVSEFKRFNTTLALWLLKIRVSKPFISAWWTWTVLSK